MFFAVRHELKISDQSGVCKLFPKPARTPGKPKNDIFSAPGRIFATDRSLNAHETTCSLLGNFFDLPILSETRIDHRRWHAFRFILGPNSYEIQP
jgi:hypothetical protein